MLESRVTVVLLLGYIIGIIVGLYCKISIVLFYALFLFSYGVIKLINKKINRILKKKLKLISFTRYLRYVKIIFTKKVITIISISSVISNSVVLYQNFKYNNLYQGLNEKEVICRCKIISNVQKKEYRVFCKIKVISVDNNYKAFPNTYLNLSIKSALYKKILKRINTNLKYGQEIVVKGRFVEPDTRRNYKGFDYKDYLKTLNIYGTLEVEDIHLIRKNAVNTIFIKCNDLSNKIKSNINNYFNEKQQGIILGIILGDRSQISEEMKDDFSSSNISHVLAVSGMHLSYVILIFGFIFNNIFGRKFGIFLISLIILLYMFITGFSPSVVRAGITGILLLLSEFFKMRSDTWENIATSMFIILIYNPFLIKSANLILSYAGTIGIILLNKNILETIKCKEKCLEKKVLSKSAVKIKFILKFKDNKIFIKIREAIVLTISVYLVLFPIIMYIYNKVVFLSLLISVIVGFIAIPTVICGIIFVLVSFSKIDCIIAILVECEKFLVIIIIKISEFGSNLLLNNFTVITPNYFEIIIYYVILFSLIFLLKLYLKKSLNQTEKRVKNLISLFKYRINQNKTKIRIVAFIICFVFISIKLCPNDLKVYFIDVGQGDSTLIVTPKNQRILIDGGGSLDKKFDVGKRTLLPYLLDRKIDKIDYILISHFDVDHIGGILTVMKELKVKKVIISKQGESSENYQEFKRIINEKNIEVIVVKMGDVINIEKNIKLYILWPGEEMIKQNVLNNNSIVAKFIYNDFSMLFTGDIEKQAEELILNKKINLKADVLKVAHHRFKIIDNTRFFASSFSKDSFDRRRKK